MDANMIRLHYSECLAVNGCGILGWIVPCAVGFIFGGPAGAMVVAATFIATKGVDNLEHLGTTGQIPSLGHSLFGHDQYPGRGH